METLKKVRNLRKNLKFFYHFYVKYLVCLCFCRGFDGFFERFEDVLP